MDTARTHTTHTPCSAAHQSHIHDTEANTSLQPVGRGVWFAEDQQECRVAHTDPPDSLLNTHRSCLTTPEPLVNPHMHARQNTARRTCRLRAVPSTPIASPAQSSLPPRRTNEGYVAMYTDGHCSMVHAGCLTKLCWEML